LGYVPSGGSCMNDKDARTVLAYRKVNGVAHNSHAGRGIVKRVFSGRGAFHLKHPDDGDHVGPVANLAHDLVGNQRHVALVAQRLCKFNAQRRRAGAPF